VQQAIQRALELLKNAVCAGFIGGDSLYTPSNVLEGLAGGNPQYGDIQVAAIPPVQGTPVNATTTIGRPFVQTNLLVGDPPSNASNPTAIITMNSNELSWNYPHGSDFGFSQTDRNAVTVLHELGHAINFMSAGLGSSGIVQDGPQVPGGCY